HVLEKGYDHQFGGPYKDYDRTTGTMQLYGLPDSTKAWWQMEQAFTAGLELYRLTDDPSYLDMADETISFFMDHFVDPVYGEVYADRTRRGDGIPQWGDHKGNGYKAAYHSVETGWYGYLYGHLALARTPATIHYRFDASDAERVVTLAPLENDTSMGEGYAIYSVSYSGMPWTSFDAATNTLIIPPSVEGVFTVVFDQANVVAVEQPSDQTRTLEVWPNPTRDHISIRLGDAFTGSAHLTRSIQWYLIDALGRTVQRGDMTHLSSTSPTWHLETNFLASGVYTLLVTDTVQRVSKRVVILK
ncbi:MAG: T9SS type A sorting domain-containing protein, partial [Rhodothermales bacterium]